MILSLFATKHAHPLADPRELKRVLGDLPQNDDVKALDELVGWLESLQNADAMPADILQPIVRALDEAGHAPVRRLTREYLTAPRLSRNIERKYWEACSDFWSRLSALYALTLSPFLPEDSATADAEARKAAEKQRGKVLAALRPELPRVAARAVAAAAAAIKWARFRYGPGPAGAWRRSGALYLIAVSERVADVPVALYPPSPGMTTVALEYLKMVALDASSLDRLAPLEIELAEKLVGHFLSDFVLTAEPRSDNLYWIDPLAGNPPRRLASPPPNSPTVRLIALGSAPARVAELIAEVERGVLPPTVNLGGQYSARRVLAVLRHLALYWAPQPPMRQHQRHAVRGRMAVVPGFAPALATILAGGGEAAADSWVVDNVSLGGFGTSIENLRDDSGVPMRIGTLLALQPSGGDNWLIGVVRRFGKGDGGSASAGVQTIARQPRVVALRLRTSNATTGGEPVTVILLLDLPLDGVADVRMALPSAVFDLRESYDAVIDGTRRLFSPVELIENGPDYDLARYRVLVEA